jgi:hypothetical protein
MNLPPEKKPSLSDLFDSKKLDVPSDEFWDNFQDQVRCKTLTSVVTDNNQTSVLKYISYFIALFAFTSVSYWVFFSPTRTTVTIVDNTDDANLIAFVIPDPIIIESSHLGFDPSLDSVISLEESEDFFVVQNYFASSLESSFQHRILEDHNDYIDESVVEFTF